MNAPLRSLLVAGLLVVSACNPAPSPTSSTIATPSPTPAATGPIAACMPVEPTPPPSGVILWDDTGPLYRPQAGRDGGTVVVGSRHPAMTFNPFDATTAGDVDVRAATWSGLVKFTRPATYAPDLARVLPTVQNGLVAVPGVGGDAMTVTWCLRDGLRWSDGAPLTCDDFIYAHLWLKTIASPRTTAAFGDLRAVDCPAPDVLVAHYGTVFSGYLGWALLPLPRHYLQAFSIADLHAGAGFRAADLAKLPVAGPFGFVSASTVELRLARNPFYRGGTRGAESYLNALTIRWFQSDDAIVAAYRAGQISIAANLDQTDLHSPRLAGVENETSAFPSLSYLTLRLNWSPASGVDGLGGCSLNARVTIRGPGCPIADQAIRTAIAATIDVGSVAQALTPDDLPATGSMVPPDAYFFIDRPVIASSPSTVAQALDDAGWLVAHGATVRSKRGLQAVVELCTSDDRNEIRAGALIATEAAAIGIRVVVRSVPSATLDVPFALAKRTSPCALSRSNFDMAIDLVTSSIEASDYRLRYGSTAFEPKGGNDARISDPELDGALDKATNTADFVVTRNGMQTFQIDAAKLVVEIPLATVRRIDLVSPHVGNWFAAEAPATWNVADWFSVP